MTKHVMTAIAPPRTASERVPIARIGRTNDYQEEDLRRAYTPTAMMQAAREITGRTFKARDYMGAANALTMWVQTEKERIAAQSLA